MGENNVANSRSEQAMMYGDRLRESFGKELDELITYPDHYAGLHLDDDQLNVYTVNTKRSYVDDLQDRAGTSDINIIEVKHSLNDLYQAYASVNNLCDEGGYGGLVHSAALYIQDNSVTLYLKDCSESQVKAIKQRLPDFEGFRFEPAPEDLGPPPDPPPPEPGYGAILSTGYFALDQRLPTPNERKGMVLGYYANLWTYGFEAAKEIDGVGPAFFGPSTLINDNNGRFSYSVIANNQYLYSSPYMTTGLYQFGPSYTTGSGYTLRATLADQRVEGKLISNAYSMYLDPFYRHYLRLASYKSSHLNDGGAVYDTKSFNAVGMLGVHLASVSDTESAFIHWERVSLSLAGNSTSIIPATYV